MAARETRVVVSGDALPLAVFARAPRAGRAKTRLAPVLGDEGAAHLYSAFLRDTLRTCRRVTSVDLTVWAADDPDDPLLVDLIGPATPCRRQAEGDLGRRMGAALAAGIARSGACIVVGSDVPTLPASQIASAADALARADVVLGPAADGGYYLVGARAEVPRIFDGVRWSTRHTLADTRAAARREGLRVVETSPWYDVDTPRDLSLLRAHLALVPAAAPATARALGV